MLMSKATPALAGKTNAERRSAGKNAALAILDIDDSFFGFIRRYFP
jgi:hypothetical protein